MEDMLFAAGVSKRKMPHFYGLGYQGGEQGEHRYQILTQLKQVQFGIGYAWGNFSKEQPYYQPFFDEYILPLIVDEKGKPRSVSKIRKNIQNITFATHCHGGFVAYQIEQMMAEKLAEFYPKQMPELMSNIRMIHFSSRRPLEQTSYGKHLHIISQNDSMYADDHLLEYDNILKQIHRIPVKESALISVSPNEKVLLLEKLISEGDSAEEPEHGEILHIFAGEALSEDNKDLTPNPKNAAAIQMTRQLLRHFVEHPDDKKDLERQLKKLNLFFVEEAIERGKNFLTQEKEGEKIRRRLLSLIADWGEKWGAHLARRTKHYEERYRKRRFDASYNDFLRQRDDEGAFLFNNLKEQYLKTGDCRSLISYLKDVNSYTVPHRERGDLILLTIQRNDWSLFNALGGSKGTSFCAMSDQLPKIIHAIHPDDLYRLLPLFENAQHELMKQPETVALLMRKIKKVKRDIHKKQLEAFLGYGLGFMQENNLKALLKEASMKEKKTVKSLLANPRRRKAIRLTSLMRERDAKAPGVTLKEIQQFDGTLRNWGANLTDLRRFKIAQKIDKNLTFDKFMMKQKKFK
ncbi:MAG: hypothetical protein IKQ99_02335 [Alphaproteobacteria bacterium]|nr:hypothetical protein [Alphaproteobacteria bacterium]